MNTSDQLQKLVENYSPLLWRKVHPRIYDNLGKFNNAKGLAWACGNAVIQAMQSGLSNTAVFNEYIVAAQMDKHAMPTYFVTAQMLQALNQTTLPDELRWVDIPFPHPGMGFVFERGLVQHPAEGEIDYVALGRSRRGDLIQHSFPGAPGRRIGNGGLCMITSTHDSMRDFHYDFAASESLSPTIALLREAAKIDLGTPLLAGLVSASEVWSSNITVEAKEFNYWLTVLALKLILVMNARPEQVSTGVKLRTVKPKRHGEQPKEFWTPNIVGQHYRTESDYDPDADPSGKMRIHWRRGHFTQQPYGKLVLNEETGKWAPGLRKTLWIEPFLVGDVL